jgi:hypothetical protein
MMTLWMILFAVVALPIILLVLKGLFVVATEGGKPPLPHTEGGFGACISLKTQVKEVIWI